jgi:hypothetical protein
MQCRLMYSKIPREALFRREKPASRRGRSEPLRAGDRHHRENAVSLRRRQQDPVLRLRGLNDARPKRLQLLQRWPGVQWSFRSTAAIQRDRLSRSALWYEASFSHFVSYPLFLTDRPVGSGLGPTSLAPIIEAATRIVEVSRHQYHILLIIADGQVPTRTGAHSASYPTEARSMNYLEERTLQALIHAR